MSDLHGAGRPPNFHSLDELERLAGGTTVDIIVVGGGGAGAAAAIEARDLGASVIVLEKMDSPGGSTEVSGGSIRLVKDPAGAKEHLAYLAGGTTPQAVIDAFVEGLLEVPDWISNHGGALDPWNDEGVLGEFFPVGGPAQYRHLPTSSSIDARAHLHPEPGGRSGGGALWDLLRRNLADRDVPIVLGARVSKLLQELPSRAITGVEVEGPAGKAAINARKAVILCCGGFSRDPELILQYFGVSLPSFSPSGRAQGDGLRMAQEIGADLWHMTAPAANTGFIAPGLDTPVRIQMPDAGFVIVDQLGRRYACETSLESHAAARAMMSPDPQSAEFVRMPSFLIFDEETLAAGPICSSSRSHRWSPDNSAEVERSWIKKAESLEEMCAILTLPADELRRTLENFNHFAASKVPDAFGRISEKMRPITGPPYYAMAISPALVNTQGGPRRNERGQIAGPDGTPIPGLYGAGGFGSVWNRMYPSGGNLAEVLVSGPMAVRHASNAPTR